MTSFGLSLYANESQYLGKKFHSDLTKGDFSNIGFVFSSKIGNVTPLRFVNFGFIYHKAKSFNNNMLMEGNLGLYSQTDVYKRQVKYQGKWDFWQHTDVGSVPGIKEDVDPVSYTHLTYLFPLLLRMQRKRQ